MSFGPALDAPLRLSVLPAAMTVVSSLLPISASVRPT
jgi:hypothetical protein